MPFQYSKIIHLYFVAFLSQYKIKKNWVWRTKKNSLPEIWVFLLLPQEIALGEFFLVTVRNNTYSCFYNMVDRCCNNVWCCQASVACAIRAAYWGYKDIAHSKSVEEVVISWNVQNTEGYPIAVGCVKYTTCINRSDRLFNTLYWCLCP